MEENEREYAVLIFAIGGKNPLTRPTEKISFEKGVPKMILLKVIYILSKCGKSFPQIYKAYNFHKDHVWNSLIFSILIRGISPNISGTPMNNFGVPTNNTIVYLVCLHLVGQLCTIIGCHVHCPI